MTRGNINSLTEGSYLPKLPPGPHTVNLLAFKFVDKVGKSVLEIGNSEGTHSTWNKPEFVKFAAAMDISLEQLVSSFHKTTGLVNPSKAEISFDVVITKKAMTKGKGFFWNLPTIQLAD